MIIKSLTVNGNFRYLWLKTVVDVDLSQHCAHCLIGEYDDRIKTKPGTYTDLELKDEVYYLCGVAFPFVWKRNFHLAFKPSPGDLLIYESNGISVSIADAVALPISTEHINHPKSKYKSYATCRNWQFANWFSDNLK